VTAIVVVLGIIALIYAAARGGANHGRDQERRRNGTYRYECRRCHRWSYDRSDLVERGDHLLCHSCCVDIELGR
jgi:predicted SprT family Zn-dependent metalloprotease